MFPTPFHPLWVSSPLPTPVHFLKSCQPKSPELQVRMSLCCPDQHCQTWYVLRSTCLVHWHLALFLSVILCQSPGNLGQKSPLTPLSLENELPPPPSCHTDACFQKILIKHRLGGPEKWGSFSKRETKTFQWNYRFIHSK